MSRSLKRLAAPIVVLVAAAGFWVLTQTGRAALISARGFAEAVDHPAGPVRQGRLGKLLVRLGQRVKAGEVVAVMDTRPLELQLETAKLELAVAEATVAATLAVERAAVSRAELQVLRLRTAQDRGHAELDELEQQLSRLQKLAEQKLVQAQDLEERKRLRAGLAASLALLDAAAVQGQAGLGQPLRRSKTDEQIDLRLGPVRAEVQVRRAAVRAAELALAEASIRAGADGTVAAILHQAGEVVGVGTEVVRIAAGRPGFIVCWVPERLAVRIVVGDVARVRGVRLFDRSFEAKVVEISPQIEEVPPRARPSPNVPAWGRRVILDSQSAGPFLLGEALHVRL